jgi:UDP-N-acetyl-D-mannosaminuronic acid transferase (WecB/TagA/CpsF family)
VLGALGLQVDWKAARNFVHADDLYTPHTVLLESFFKIVNVYEFVAPSWLRRRALDWIYRVLEKEDEFTNYICIGAAQLGWFVCEQPVNSVSIVSQAR